jgi:hypothetical protein
VSFIVSVSNEPLRWMAAGVCLLASLPALAFAQTSGGDPAEEARMHLGPLALTPRFSVRNLGVDTNVFNSANLPARDVTATFGPGVDTWLRIGRARLSGETLVEWTYFKKADGQRSLNTTQLGRLELDLATVTPFVSGGIVSTRQRPNMEIDQRVRQQRTTAGLGGLVHLGGRSRLDIETRRETIDFNDDGLGSDTLTAALNREVTEGAVAFRMDLTPLTTFVVRTGISNDVFEFSHVRDSNSVVVVPGLEMKPSALLSGKASVGFRRFNAKSATVPDFWGVVAAVDVGYVMREVTRIGVKVDRNLDYSFQAEKPYYVATAAMFDVKQALGFSWDVVGRVGRARLAYQDFIGDDVGLQRAHRDRLTTYGVGVGRRLGDNIRVGFDVDHGRRESDAVFRGYEGFKAGGSFTYGY